MKKIRKFFKDRVGWPFIIGTALLSYIVWTYESGIYDWQWRRALRFVVDTRGSEISLGPLLHGLELTVYIVAMGFVLSFALGLCAALLRSSASVVGRGLAATYVACVRNTPLLIQLFIVYFIVAPVFSLSPFWAAVWSLALFEGAYMAEVFRAGITFVPQGQWDAAASLGFSRLHIIMHVVLPQALRRMLPPLTNQTVSLIKDSALVSTIALADLTLQAQVIIAETFLSLEVWVIVAALYFFLTLLVTIPARMLERYYAWRWL